VLKRAPFENTEVEIRRVFEAETSAPRWAGDSAAGSAAKEIQKKS
jgi:hypothetical protein